jgi:hypothetical protein
MIIGESRPRLHHRRSLPSSISWPGLEVPIRLVPLRLCVRSWPQSWIRGIVVGVRHGLVTVLTMAMCALLAGARSFVGITGGPTTCPRWPLPCSEAALVGRASP